jgi:hypothetical protein
VDELLQIADRMLAHALPLRPRRAGGVRATTCSCAWQQPHFANARSVRNALDRARLRQASRLFADRDRVLARDDLTHHHPADILASRVFQN